MRIFGVVLFFCFCNIVAAQNTYFQFNSSNNEFIDRLEIKSGKAIPGNHSIFKPYGRKSVVTFLEKSDSLIFNLTETDKSLIDAILFENSEFSLKQPKAANRAFLKYFYKYPQDFYRIHNEDYFIAVNPVINFDIGLEKDTEDFLYLNTRGIEVRGLINDRVGFYSFLADNQARFPSYINDKIDEQQGAVPGEGWNQQFGSGGYDFFTARGYISFKATKNIEMQFGQDKNFIGHGIRSLLLSDYSNNYLFLKINTQIGRFHYQNLFAELIDFPLRSYGGRMFDKKYSTTHTLSMNITDKFQLALFENVVYGRADDMGRRGVELHYFNPIIFYRAVEHHLGDADKVAIGLNWRWLIGKKASFYGQVYIDDFNLGDINKDIDSLMVRIGLRGERKYDEYASFRNKFALQSGLKIVDLFGIDNLDIQGEVNIVRPYVYSHYDTYSSGLRPSASYSHYSQALAHPLGANFMEYIGLLKYQPHHKWTVFTTVMYARQGVDSTGVNFGNNILNDYSDRPGDYNILFLQGNRRNVFLWEMMLSWQFRHNFWLDGRFVLRNEVYPNADILNKTHHYGLGLRMNIAARRNLL
jgi:hypothetical protein